MGVLDKIFSSAAGEVTKSVGSVIDNLTTTDAEKLNAKAALTKIVLDKLTELSALQSEVIKTEMTGNWLQRNWRPMVMMIFTLIIISKWYGFTVEIDDSLEMKLLDIVQMGLGGYVIGRTAEKITASVTQNVDLPFIKKKNRKL